MNKGILPVPRKIFKREGDIRTTPEYLSNTTPEPTRTKDLESLQDEEAKMFVEYKARSAALRRQNLRQGLVDLKSRKMRTDLQIAQTSAGKQHIFRLAVKRPQREDERLTASTIVQLLTPHALKGMNRRDHKANRSSKAKFERREAARKADRKDALHTLYMNARNFIITEEQLSKEIQRVFDSPFYTANQDRGVWDEHGFPESVFWMLNHSSGGSIGSSAKAVDQNEQAFVSRERVQRIAEELTGGKS